MAQGRWIVACAVCLSLAVPAAAFAAEKASAKGAAKGPKVTYEDDVRPIFRERCFGCHNTDKKTAGLDLTTSSAMMAGGGSGEKRSPLAQKVADLLDQARALSDADLKTQRDALIDQARQIAQQINPIMPLRQWVGHQFAELLSNPQLTTALDEYKPPLDAEK